MVVKTISVNTDYLSVGDFYAGKSVFITGGTGFLGKVMIEKLLYSCAGIEKIYILVRDKKGVSALQRLQDITDNPLFARIKAERPEDLTKLIPIAGDITVPNLGLNPVDEEIIINKVSLVFHSAATVKFNEPLKEAFTVNVEGTRNTLDLCRRIKNIQVFVHTSTTFTNTDKFVVDETVYPPPADIDEIYQMVKQHVNIVPNAKILNGRPNTYTFTKALAETYIQRNHGDLPTIIIRPSIVTAIKDEPVKGWINNWYGATGLLTSSAKGLNRFVFGSPDVILDLIPVDYVANLTIVAGAKSDRSKTLSVYNCSSSSCNPINLKKAFEIFTTVAIKHNNYVAPFPRMCIITKRKWLKFPATFLLQILPFFIVDIWRRLWGKPPRYMKLQSQIIMSRDMLEYFTSHSWVMKCSGARGLYASLAASDRRQFPCDPVDINWTQYIPDYCEGIRKFLDQRE